MQYNRLNPIDIGNSKVISWNRISVWAINIQLCGKRQQNGKVTEYALLQITIHNNYSRGETIAITIRPVVKKQKAPNMSEKNIKIDK